MHTPAGGLPFVQHADTIVETLDTLAGIVGIGCSAHRWKRLADHEVRDV